VLVLDNLVLVLGNGGGGPHYWQRSSYVGLGIGLNKLVVLTSNIHQIFNGGYLFSFALMFSLKTRKKFRLCQPHS
jgi:hypothetical protein